MTTRRTEASVQFECTNEVCDEMPTWTVEGRWNAEGEFEPTDPDDMRCEACEEVGGPGDIDIEVAAV
jgi:hypothetical protein